MFMKLKQAVQSAEVDWAIKTLQQAGRIPAPKSANFGHAATPSNSRAHGGISANGNGRGGHLNGHNLAYATPQGPNGFHGNHIPIQTSYDYSRDANAWKRLMNVSVSLRNPKIVPVKLPMRKEPEFQILASGRPAVVFTADGFTANGKPIQLFCVPNWQDGNPLAVYETAGIGLESFVING